MIYLYKTELIMHYSFELKSKMWLSYFIETKNYSQLVIN